MRAFIAALCVASTLIALAAAAGAADAPSPQRKALLDSTVRFLQESQQQNGGFAQAGEPSQGTSAWVALALAAAGVNPRNQAQPCGTDAYTYLASNFGEEFGGAAARIATTEFERELLVVNAAGADPHDFAGFDLVGEILARQLPDGSFPYLPGDGGRVNATAFAILALSPVEGAEVEPALRDAAEWLLSQQGGDGGWAWQGRPGVSEVDITGAAIEALNAAGPPEAAAARAAFEAAQRQAFAYLEEAQLPDGGFPARPGSLSESNVASTAWAVQGIWSAGDNPETWRTGSGLASEEPLDYLESMQQPDGHIRWSRSVDSNGVWMTAYVVPVFAGQALPIPAATYSAASLPPCDPPETGADAGVIAGGGGRGAPLFSRPKPQSRGRTPGGARVVRNNEGLRPRNHSDSRRGENAAQPAGTATAEPREAERESETTAVSSSAGRGGGGRGSGSGASDAGAGARSRTGEEGVPAPLREAAEDVPAGSGGREVSGVVIGDLGSDRGELAFGAPGLRSADAGEDPEPWVAVAVGAAALLAMLGGARWERRPREVLP